MYKNFNYFSIFIIMKKILLCIPFLFSHCDKEPLSPPVIDYEIYNIISISNPVDAVQDGFHRVYRFTGIGVPDGGMINSSVGTNTTIDYIMPTHGDTLLYSNRFIRRTNLTNGFTYFIGLHLIYPLFPGSSPFDPIVMATPGCVDIEIATYLNDTLFDTQSFQMGFAAWDGIDSSFNSATSCGIGSGPFEEYISIP